MTKTIWEHLMEFKNVILRLLFVWVVFTIGTTFFSDEINRIFTAPLEGQVISFLSPTDSFMYLIKIHLFFGFLTSLPVLLLILWQYLNSALETKEKKFFLFYIFSVLILSLGALFYGYFSIIPISLEFLLSISPEGTQVMLTSQEYTSFLISLLLLLILVFQTPILIFGLIRTGIIKPTTLTNNRKYLYFTLVVVLAMLTPPDVLSLFLTFIPISILLEASIWFASLGIKKEDR